LVTMSHAVKYCKILQ